MWGTFRSCKFGGRRLSLDVAMWACCRRVEAARLVKRFGNEMWLTLNFWPRITLANCRELPKLVDAQTISVEQLRFQVGPGSEQLLQTIQRHHRSSWARILGTPSERTRFQSLRFSGMTSPSRHTYSESIGPSQILYRSAIVGHNWADLVSGTRAISRLE